MSRTLRFVATLFVPLGLLAVGLAGASTPVEVSLRVHMMQSGHSEIGTGGTQRALLRHRAREINDIFAPTGIRFVHDSTRYPRVTDTSAWRAVKPRDRPSRKVALLSLVRQSEMLAPAGLDLFVVDSFDRFDIGGAYQCAAGGEGRGAAFIAIHGPQGRELHPRKWAHELGHALGLPHTPCESRYADNLMMSGKCEHARRGRVDLNRRQVEIMRAQAIRGGPARCKR